MMHKDFWSKSVVGVVGAGQWGSVLAGLAASNTQEVRVWARNEAFVSEVRRLRINPLLGSSELAHNLKYTASLKEFFSTPLDFLLWCLPSRACREVAQKFAPFLSGGEICVHVAKGLEIKSLKRVSEVLLEEMPIRRIGALSGPNLALEVAQGQIASCVVGSPFEEVFEASQAVLQSKNFRVEGDFDLIGVEWAGVLKNIYAIAAGALDGLNLGWNSRAFLLTTALKEIVRLGTFVGAKESTFLGLAGVGDLIATCNSSLSRNYQVGFRLARGEASYQVLSELGPSAEGVQTVLSVWKFAHEAQISLPLVDKIYGLLQGSDSLNELLNGMVSWS